MEFAVLLILVGLNSIVVYQSVGLGISSGARFQKMECSGIEPLTSTMPLLRSTN